MKSTLHIIFFLCFGLLGFGQTTLSYHLEKDDVFTIFQKAHQVITQTIEGAEHQVTNDIEGVLEFKVLGQKEGHYEIALTFKDLNMKMTSNLQGEMMNVRAKEAEVGDMQSQVFNSLLNSPVQITLAKTGDILAVKGGDSLVAKMAKASGLTDEYSLNLMKKSLSDEFGSEAMANSYEQMTFIYPDKSIKIGDFWENNYNGKLTAKNRWVLNALDERQAEISGTAQVDMDVTEPGTTMKLEGSQVTEITADLKSGFIEMMKVEGRLDGTGTMVQLGEQKIPTAIITSITYQLIK
jgi:hypothetical protein